MRLIFDILSEIFAAIVLAFFLWLILSHHAKADCYPNARMFWAAGHRGHAYWHMDNGRKCWDGKAGHLRRPAFRLAGQPTPRPRPPVGIVSQLTIRQDQATQQPRVSASPMPSIFEQAFSVFPDWRDRPDADAFFSQQLMVKFWRQWLAESMARADQIRERLGLYPSRPEVVTPGRGARNTGPAREAPSVENGSRPR